MTGRPTSPPRRLPPWLKKRIRAGRQVQEVRDLLAGLHLHTVCDGAHCPNQGECYARGTATFLILGETCTRNCRFCAIEDRPPGPLRDAEPDDVAEACARLNLHYVVITSVTRDDLPDGGARHFARTLRAVKDRTDARVEVLTPDFQGDPTAIATVIHAGPDVFNHNVETVPELYPAVRPQAGYRQSLEVLRLARQQAQQGGRKMYTKSGLMVGLGETDEQVVDVLRDLRSVQCDVLTIGQYLAPSGEHHPVQRFVPPEQFERWQAVARELGFASVASGPFVRSSYHADLVFPDEPR